VHFDYKIVESNIFQHIGTDALGCALDGRYNIDILERYQKIDLFIEIVKFLGPNYYCISKLLDIPQCDIKLYHQISKIWFDRRIAIDYEIINELSSFYNNYDMKFHACNLINYAVTAALHNRKYYTRPKIKLVDKAHINNKFLEKLANLIESYEFKTFSLEQECLNDLILNINEKNGFAYLESQLLYDNYNHFILVFKEC